MTKLVDAIQTLLDNKTSVKQLNNLSIDLYKAAEKKAVQEEKKVEIDEGIWAVPLEKVYEHLEAILYEQLKSMDLVSEPKRFVHVYEAINSWNPGELTNEETQCIALVQGLLLNKVLERIYKEQQQQQLRSILKELYTGLSEGKKILEEKKEKLEQKKSDKNTSEKIKILKDAIGDPEPSWALDNAAEGPKDTTFNALSAYIKQKTDSEKSITQDLIKDIYSNFDKLMKEKVINPLKKYDEERGFLARFKEWVSDTTKKIFGINTLSTKEVLVSIASNENSLFSIGKRRAAKLFASADNELDDPKSRI
ncbi:hypothetical protein FOG18_11840 [Legionella israelensis]|uniref:hypothetical protein n=1 Tax=Legionella israelensis TaxID=454 RepID=UPI00117DFF1D|nr:hypothetical protein [Legionella israelensis]QDP73201.1 hypothetical protein FOG18_11840 [Legionella israelensis]